MDETIEDIVLIGPVRAGKSTLAKLLAARLGLPQVSLDDLRRGYYQEIGYDPVFAEQVRGQGGFLALVLYWNLFDAYAVERLLAEHHGCVIDFGAGIYESRESLGRVKQALEGYRNVILLLPSPDRQESLRILRERDPNPPADLRIDLMARFLGHPSYYDLAKFTVYNGGEAPQETCQKILRLIRR